MSLFRGLNEAPTTKGGPACSRTACPPAPDAHNSFIQEPHVHTKAPKSIRHPATLDNALNLLRIEASNEGTAFRGDQTAGLPLKASKKKTILSKRRVGRGRGLSSAAGARGGCALAPEARATLRQRLLLAGLPPVLARQLCCEGPGVRHSPARATVPLGLGALCSGAPCEPPPPAFPTGSCARTVGGTHMQMPAGGCSLGC